MHAEEPNFARDRAPRVGAERILRNAAKRGLRWSFELAQRAGVNVLPEHFYSSVPNIEYLTSTDFWREPWGLAGIAGAEDLDQQLAVLIRWLERRSDEPLWQYVLSEHGEPGYGPIEADVLYAFISVERPRRVVQVGAGASTAIVLKAARDADYSLEVVCIDPFPTTYLSDKACSGQIRLLREPGQTVDIAEFLALGHGDLLFVDSTHTVKPGSEVNRIVLDVLPRLSDGVWVHFHDITFPYGYSRGILRDDLFFWNESNLVHAFLIGNTRFSIQVSMSMLHYGRAEALVERLPWYVPQAASDGLRLEEAGHFPSALYVRAETVPYPRVA